MLIVQRVFAGLFLMLLAAAAVQADDGVFNRFFTGLKTFRADFTQMVYGQNGEVIQQGAGEVYIQRPGRFRWNYVKPYEQVILGDGTTLWTYDADLAQATRKPQGEALVGTPAVLLSEVEDPATLFNIQALPAADGLTWVELTPKSSDSQFETIRLGFSSGMLARMVLLDNFDQRTEIHFLQPQRNVALAADLFRFTPPPGTDVIGAPAQP